MQQNRNIQSCSSEKEAVGKSAAMAVNDGMVIGVGTGSTTAYAIKEIGRRVVEEGLDIKAVPTSYQSEMLSIDSGVPLTTLAENPVLDLAIDGADQVDANLFAIKGGGAAQTREKVVSCSANHFILLVDESKLSYTLDHFVPLEILPYARGIVCKQIEEMNGSPELRMANRKDGPIISDNGNFIIDAYFGTIEEPEVFSKKLSLCVGVVEHGIFSNVDEIYVGKKDGNVEIIS